ncbi:MAG TPA: hypothetical protein VFK38_07435, partial [Candidatus Limnocylindrales bacterium]|nr:hypothetical protein [Candidatus Limnocylindrales bacterium]
VFDFQGVLTHEVGHTNGLGHTATCTSGDPGIFTMCPGTGLNGYPDSYRLRTITTDDILSADGNIP